MQLTTFRGETRLMIAPLGGAIQTGHHCLHSGVRKPTSWRPTLTRRHCVASMTMTEKVTGYSTASREATSAFPMPPRKLPIPPKMLPGHVHGVDEVLPRATLASSAVGNPDEMPSHTAESPHKVTLQSSEQVGLLEHPSTAVIFSRKYRPHSAQDASGFMSSYEVRTAGLSSSSVSSQAATMASIAVLQAPSSQISPNLIFQSSLFISGQAFSAAVAAVVQGSVEFSEQTAEKSEAAISARIIIAPRQ